MLGKILYESYKESTDKRKMSAYSFLITDRLDIRCGYTERKGKLFLDMSFTNKQLPKDWKDRGIRDITFHVDGIGEDWSLGNILLSGITPANRHLEKEAKEQSGLPFGWLHGKYYKQPDLFFRLGGKDYSTVINEIQAAVDEFRERVGNTQLQRTRNNFQIYPYKAKAFFQSEFEGLGPIFEEDFRITCALEDTATWDDEYAQEARPDLPGFKITTHNHRFKFKFEYHSGHGVPKMMLSQNGFEMEHPAYRGAQANSRAYRLELDKSLNPQYARAYLNAHGVEDAEKKDTGFILETMTAYWEEFRKAFRIDQRIEENKEISPEDVKLAQHLARYRDQCKWKPNDPERKRPENPRIIAPENTFVE